MPTKQEEATLSEIELKVIADAEEHREGNEAAALVLAAQAAVAAPTKTQSMILVQARPARTRPKYLKIGIIGDPGVGKTFLAGTIEDAVQVKRALMIDVEGGSMTIAGRDIDVIRVTSWSDLQSIYKELYAMCFSDSWDGPMYDAVIIDTLTELQKMSMMQIMAEVVADKSDRDPYVPAQREWGKSQEQIRRLVRAFRDLPLHVIFTFHGKDDQDPTTGEVKVRPSLPGKLAAEVAGFLDVLGYLAVRSLPKAGDNPNKEMVDTRVILFQPTGKYTAKDRSGKLGNVMVNPTMPIILDKILGSPDDSPVADDATSESDS